MRQEQASETLLGFDNPMVVCLDGRAGLLIRTGDPQGNAGVQIEGEREIRWIHHSTLAQTEVPGILTESAKWGGLGAWPEFRNSLRSIDTGSGLSVYALGDVAAKEFHPLDPSAGGKGKKPPVEQKRKDEPEEDHPLPPCGEEPESTSLPRTEDEPEPTITPSRPPGKRL